MGLEGGEHNGEKETSSRLYLPVIPAPPPPAVRVAHESEEASALSFSLQGECKIILFRDVCVLFTGNLMIFKMAKEPENRCRIP